MTFARTSDGPPKQYILDLVPNDNEDLSSVTAAVLKVEHPDKSKTTWDATISNQTNTTLRLTHVYTTGIFPKKGFYSVYAVLTVPGGTLESEPRLINVKDAFDAT